MRKLSIQMQGEQDSPGAAMADSEGPQEQVVEGLQEDVMPHHEDAGLRNLAHALDGELNDIGEVALADFDLSRM